MATARPLRDVFADVTGDARASDPGEVLRASGHEDLPDTLVAEAVTSFADTAPLEVAEHLSQFVMANSPVPGVGSDVDPSTWLEALSTAPEVLDDSLDPTAAGLDDQPPADAGPDASDPGDADEAPDAFDLDFGVGDAVDAFIAHTVDFVIGGPEPESASEAFGAGPGTADETFGAGPGTGHEAFGATASDDAFGAAAPDGGDEGDDEPDDEPTL